MSLEEEMSCEDTDTQGGHPVVTEAAGVTQPQTQERQGPPVPPEARRGQGRTYLEFQRELSPANTLISYVCPLEL